MMAPDHANRQVVCLGCSLLCHDVDVTIDDGVPRQFHTNCELGKRWFAQSIAAAEHDCYVAGSPVDRELGLETAAAMIRDSKLPLIYGLTDQGVRTQQVAIRLARQIDAVVDWTHGRTANAMQHALQQYGQVSCTLGEIPNRADLVLTWFSDPWTTHPRFVPRFAERYMAVDNQETPTTANAEHHFQWNVLGPTIAARALASQLGSSGAAALGDGETTSGARKATAPLAQRLQKARYIVLIVDDTLADRFGLTSVLAINKLVRGINQSGRHCRLVHLRQSVNSMGMENVLSWLTGYPQSVGYRNGSPVFRPDEFTVESLVVRAWTDLLILVGDDQQVPGHLRELPQFKSMAKVVFAHHLGSSFDPRPNVEFRASRCGLDESGTVFRTDGVPVEVQAIVASPLPCTSDLLTRLAAKLA